MKNILTKLGVAGLTALILNPVNAKAYQQEPEYKTCDTVFISPNDMYQVIGNDGANIFVQDYSDELFIFFMDSDWDNCFESAGIGLYRELEGIDYEEGHVLEMFELPENVGYCLGEY